MCPLIANLGSEGILIHQFGGLFLRDRIEKDVLDGGKEHLRGLVGFVVVAAEGKEERRNCTPRGERTR